MELCALRVILAKNSVRSMTVAGHEVVLDHARNQTYAEKHVHLFLGLGTKKRRSLN